MAIVHQERDEKSKAANEKKKRDDEEKVAKRAEKEKKALEEKQRLGPVCKEHVEKGLSHVLNLKVDERKDILRIHFGFGLASFLIDGVEVPIYKLNKAGSEAALRSLIELNELNTSDCLIESNELNTSDSIEEDLMPLLPVLDNIAESGV